MTTNKRRLGVFGENLPTKKTLTVEPSDFSIGGFIGQFERKFKVAFLCRNIDEFQEIFGLHIISTYYGWDVVKSFFDNLEGADGKAYIKSYVGYTGSAYDAVTATKNFVDGSAVNTLQIDDAYKTELGFGVSGNRTGITITNGDRFTTACKTANLLSDTFVILDSVAGVRVGDIMKFVATAGGGATVYKKITSIEESTGKVNFTGAFDGAANMDVDDVATVIGFKIKTYRKDINGVVNEVDTDLGKIWCTMEPEVTDYYVENVFAESKWIKATDLDSVSVVEASFPANVATVTYMESGADGTTPTGASNYSQDLLAFNDLPIRFISNAEETLQAINEAGELYCQGRWDTPKWIYNIPENQSQSQLETIGNNYQRSNDVLGVIVANWIKVTDPFATAQNAPYRHVPNTGFVMGAWIRSIETLGIHYIPAVPQIPLYGVQGIVGDTFLDDDIRTILAESGINVIQDVSGSGTIIKNFFTPSTATEFNNANGPLMRDYIQVSVRDSLLSTENEPNSFNRIKSGRNAIVNFFYSLWESGSNGNIPKGETFGQSQNDDGSATGPEQHFQVQADLVNNPQADINNGQRDYDSWFTAPTPASSIRIGVGLWLR